MRKILDFLFQKKAWWIGINAALMVVFYVLFLIFDQSEDHVKLIWTTPVISAAIGFGVYAILAFQVFNPLCRDGFFYFVELIFLAFSVFSAVTTAIHFFSDLSNGFLPDYCAGYALLLAIYFADRTWLKKRVRPKAD